MNKRVKTLTLNGRGISFGDAAGSLRFDGQGNPVLDADPEKFRDGVLRLVRRGNRAVPVIKFEGEEEDALCTSFQWKQDDGSYVDLNLKVISDALSLKIAGSQT